MNLHQAVRALGFKGDLVEGVRFAGELVCTAVRPDADEIDRRRSHGLSAITDIDLVEALASLPLHHPIPWDQIDPIARAVLDVASPGVLVATEDDVERVCRPPLSVSCVLVAGRNWASGLSSASLFAPDAARALVLDRLPRRPERLIELASRSGVGVIVAQGEWRVVVPPGRSGLRRPGPRHWRFLETVYAEWLKGGLASQP